LLNELAVGRDGIVEDGLEGGAAEVGRHCLELGEAVFLGDYKVV
jgi:hypothetical protein